MQFHMYVFRDVVARGRYLYGRLVMVVRLATTVAVMVMCQVFIRYQLVVYQTRV